jgi:rubrerythrin
MHGRRPEEIDKMDANTERVVEGLHKAIEAEAAGYHFYMMAARSTEDGQGRQIFEKLAEEELEHLNFLKAHHNSFLQTGKPDAGANLGKPLDLSGSSPIFSDGLKKRLDESHYEMSALSIGIELELNAVKFYTDEANAAKDQVVRDFYTRLAEWESGHYHALLKQQGELRQDYWAQGGFSPF